MKLGPVIFLLLLWSGSSWADGRHYQLEVDGLACPFCAYGIEKQLSKLEGVERLEVDISKGQVLIRMTDGASLNKTDAEQAVKKAGFTLRTFAPVVKEQNSDGGP